MTLLAVNNLTKKYEKHIAVNRINFEFTKEKCIALIGPNGAGKTTILRMLAGLLKPTSGTVQFPKQYEKDIRFLIGYLPQFPVFYAWMTGMEFLVYCGRLAYLTKSEAELRAIELLTRVGLVQAKNKRIGSYSGGMKQRLGIAQAIIHRPQLLMLDEPVSALDPLGRREVLTLLEELKKEMTILFSTHILSDAEEVCDELLLLHNGKIVEAGPMNILRKKYQTAKIELEFQDEVELYQQKVNSLPTVSSSTIERNILTISTININATREAILKRAAEEKWQLTSFTINRTSLEDLFMKVVKNECNG